jgi:hypothetical protein
MKNGIRMYVNNSIEMINFKFSVILNVRIEYGNKYSQIKTAYLFVRYEK